MLHANVIVSFASVIDLLYSVPPSTMKASVRLNSYSSTVANSSDFLTDFRFIRILAYDKRDRVNEKEVDRKIKGLKVHESFISYLELKK